MKRDPEDLVQVLVGRYPAGAGIGWHHDAPIFGSDIAGVSLLARCRMRFQRRSGGERSVAELELERRSAYLMSGSARWSWQHSIPAAKALRYSITFARFAASRAAQGRERAIDLRSSGLPAHGDFRLNGGSAGNQRLYAVGRLTEAQPPLCRHFDTSSGGGGIRTLDGPIRPITVFETAAFNHSATPPGVARAAFAVPRYGGSARDP